jgi:hypothetical protein
MVVLIGAFYCRNGWRQHYVLWMVPINLMLVHSVFHVEPRYTLEARLFLLIYAGVAVERFMLLTYKKLLPETIKASGDAVGL